VSKSAHYWELPLELGSQLPASVRVAVSSTSLGNLGLNAKAANADDVSRLRHQVRVDHDLPAVTWLQQVHGTVAVMADTAADHAQADASFTQKPRHACAVLTADCLPILLMSADGARVAAVHAGWRGLFAGVIENTVQQADMTGGVALIAPAIGPCCFEVGSDVRDAFLDAAASDQHEQISSCFRPTAPNKCSSSEAVAPNNSRSSSEAVAQKFHADLPALAQQRLQRLGFSALQSAICTRCDPRFYSHRASVAGARADGRFVSMIWREPISDLPR
jgi:polyphenol oxidase